MMLRALCLMDCYYYVIEVIDRELYEVSARCIDNNKAYDFSYSELLIDGSILID